MAPMRVDVISLVPEAFEPLLGAGVIGRAFAAGIAALHRHNPRDFATDRKLAVARGDPAADGRRLHIRAGVTAARAQTHVSRFPVRENRRDLVPL